MAITKVGDIDLDQDAWNLRAFMALRPQLFFDAEASVKPTEQAMNGAAVKFELFDDLAVASAALNESTDVTPATMSDSQVTVTLAEYGNAVQTTAKVRGTSFLPVDPVVADLVGYNAGISIDTVCRDILAAGTNVTYATGGATTPTARNTVEPNDTITAHDVRIVRSELVGASSAPHGAYYNAYVHPDVAIDLREETGSGAWRTPHEYAQPGEIWTGEIGVFESFRWIESPRAAVFADAGSSTTLTDVYATLFTGQQALAKAWSKSDGNGPYPKVVPSPVIDILRRFTGMGWYWLGSYAVFRQASLWRIDSASTVGSN